MFSDPNEYFALYITIDYWTRSWKSSLSLYAVCESMQYANHDSIFLFYKRKHFISQNI